MQINHILFFIHPPITYSYHDLLRPAPEIAANCRQAMVARASDPACAVWIVQSGKGDKPLVDSAREHFGERCIVDANDNSEATRLLLAGDMERTYRGRGRSTDIIEASVLAFVTAVNRAIARSSAQEPEASEGSV